MDIYISESKNTIKYSSDNNDVYIASDKIQFLLWMDGLDSQIDCLFLSLLGLVGS